MAKSSKERDLLLQESQTETELKSYFSKMKQYVGEEYANLILSSDIDINTSLSLFSSKFKDV